MKTAKNKRQAAVLKPSDARLELEGRVYTRCTLKTMFDNVLLKRKHKLMSTQVFYLKTLNRLASEGESISNKKAFFEINTFIFLCSPSRGKQILITKIWRFSDSFPWLSHSLSYFCDNLDRFAMQSRVFFLDLFCQRAVFCVRSRARAKKKASNDRNLETHSSLADKADTIKYFSSVLFLS